MLLRNFLGPLFICLALAACDSAEEKAQAHYERGLELLSEGDGARARLEFRNALKEVGTMIEPRLELARMNRAEGAIRPALREYLRVAEQDPQNLEANIALGELNFRTQNWEAFERYTTAAIAQAPETPAVQILDIALKYRAASLNEDAPARSALLIEAETLQAESPDSTILHRILIDGYIGEARLSDALVQIDKAIDAEPKQLQLYNLKLQTLAQLGEEDAIAEELYRMAAIFPKVDSVQSNLLRFLLARDKLDEVETLLRDRVAAAPEGDDSATVNLVRFLLQFRSQEAATQELEAAIGSQPDAYTLRALHASLRFDAGARDEAITAVQDIIDTVAATEGTLPQEELENIKIMLATMLAQSGNEVGARRLIDEVLSINPEVVGALKMQARWMITDDDADGAINAMRLALSQADQDFEAMTIMAEAYYRAGKQDLMLDFLSRAAEASNNAPEQTVRYAMALRDDEKLVQAESTLIRSLRIQPTNVDVLAALGRIYMDLDTPERAQKVADTLKKIDTESARSSAANLELQILSRGSGDEQMMAYLEGLAGEDDSSDNGAQIALVRARLQVGEYDKARTLINELIQSNPDNPAFVYFRGLTESTLGDYPAAKRTFSELTTQYPDIDLGWVQLARLQSIQEDPELVLATLDTALSHNPDSPDLLWAKASYLQEQSDIDGAILVYEQLYEQNSGSLIIANNLASLLATFRDDAESLERARLIARRLNGTDVPALQDTYGWILFRTGQTEEALKYLVPAAENLPEDASVQFHLGEVYNALGRQEDALKQMRLAMQKVGPLGSERLTSAINNRIATLEKAPAGTGSPTETNEVIEN